MTKKKKKSKEILKEEVLKDEMELAAAEETEPIKFEEEDDADIFTGADLISAMEEADAKQDSETKELLETIKQQDTEGPDNPPATNPDIAFLVCPFTGAVVARHPGEWVDYVDDKNGIHYKGRASNLKIRLVKNPSKVLMV